MLAYKHYEMVAGFANELNVVLKCPSRDCGHIFSPALSYEEMRIVVGGSRGLSRVA
jgi:hypothetical protein